jgi:hypothetical protein
MSKLFVGRRQFTIGAAAAAAVALVRPGEALAQSTGPAMQSLEEKTRAAMAKLSPLAQAEVEMKVSEIFRKYGDKLNDEQKNDIRKVLAETQEGLDKMRAFSLQNGDQPAAMFHAFRGEGKK